jgi:hypothetical protein
VEGRNSADWVALLRNHTAVVGLPAAALAADLAAALPAARVVVVAPDPRRAARALAAGRFGFEAHWAVRLMALLYPPLRVELSLADAALGASFAGFSARRPLRPDEEDKAAAACRRWAERAAAAAPPDRVLLWDPRDGLAPLAAFLGVPVPPAAAAAALPDPEAEAGRWWRRRAGWHAAAYAALAGPPLAALALGWWAGNTLGYRSGCRIYRPHVAKAAPAAPAKKGQ